MLLSEEQAKAYEAFRNSDEGKAATAAVNRMMLDGVFAPYVKPDKAAQDAACDL